MYPAARQRSLLPIFACALLAACSSTPPTATQSVSIMTFNVENLFDTADDPGKDDATVLPLAAKQNAAHRAGCAKIEVERWRDQCLNWDWNEHMLARKLQVLADAILQVNDGRGADIVALQEVENRAILERLRRDYLAAAGYRPAILIEGGDARGIDVAFLSRLPQAAPAVLHGVDFDDDVAAARKLDTRGILEASFRLPDGTVLTGFAAHFPAPFHPTAMRVSSYRALNRLLERLPPGRPAFAAGDFNTTAAEDRDQHLLARFVEPSWTVAHRIGCGGCPGTQYYAADDSWSFLDMILWSPARRGENATWHIRADSVQLANMTPAQRKKDGTPARFEVAAGSGVSDHWPLVAEIQSN